MTTQTATDLAMEIVTKPKLERQYFSRSKSIKYVFGDKPIAGHVANFINFRFTTADKNKIAELDREIEANHPELYTKPGELEIDPRLQDPKLAMRVEVIQDLLAAEAKATNPDNDMGSYTPGPLNPVNTSNIAGVAAGGDASSLHSRIKSLIPASVSATK